MSDLYDVAIVGGGHNGLTAAAYLASAGKRVIVLEKLDTLGGAAVSAQAFDGVDARLSRYSYLVSLLPQRIVQDLGLDIRLKRRRYSSYTPVPGGDGGLLIDNGDPAATTASFASIGAFEDAAAWRDFYAATSRLGQTLFPTVLDPLLTRSEARTAVGDERVWQQFIERPVGQAIESSFTSDLVRGVVLTDALIGTFAPTIDPTLAANHCFLYHVIGGGTGDWDVPVGGMGAVTGELARAARLAGASFATGAEVTGITPDGEVTYVVGGTEQRLGATTVLANVSPWTLDGLLDGGSTASLGSSLSSPKPEGAQVKVNLLLSRLPRLHGDVDPVAAFGGTFHINEGWQQLQDAYDAAAAGRMPELLPAEIYCHTLTDPTILSPELRATGAQTLTLFGLHAPDRIDASRDDWQAAALRSLNSVLAEPIEPLLMTDAAGNPCIETKTTRDLEATLGLPGGNIFHGPLAWPFAEEDDNLGTPAERWGVATEHERVLLCGSGARRGGAVSGIAGHNAAMAVLESSIG
ncbi:NAD(P)/FAD-dependent oxidoreductase [Diaminobutyricimonas sp. TR449]|uniref:phytoene desaturase family protein n=1 Tax=Diaminobutyricimonas sp. TR449 TaxID=2708076 RepID=UPI0014224314|nr:NAD(P)/FAD-dependent oxidoreductase [Diaminobutyricimonas sp. TR449]